MADPKCLCVRSSVESIRGTKLRASRRRPIIANRSRPKCFTVPAFAGRNHCGHHAGDRLGRIVEEVPAGASMPVWRRDADAGPLSIRITPRGLARIGLEGDVMQLAKEPSTAERRADGSPKRPPRAVALRQKGGQGPQRAAKPGRGQSKQAKVLALFHAAERPRAGYCGFSWCGTRVSADTIAVRPVRLHSPASLFRRAHTMPCRQREADGWAQATEGHKRSPDSFEHLSIQSSNPHHNLMLPKIPRVLQ